MNAPITLTAYEKRLLELLREGYNQTEIAQQTHYTYSSIKNLLSRIYAKLGVKNSHGAVIEAIREGHIGVWPDG